MILFKRQPDAANYQLNDKKIQPIKILDQKLRMV